MTYLIKGLCIGLEFGGIVAGLVIVLFAIVMIVALLGTLIARVFGKEDEK